MATLIKFQLHDHICRKIVKQEPRACDYSRQRGSGPLSARHPQAGRHARLAQGHARGHWRGHRPARHAGFYQPLLADLAKRNQGLDCSR